MRSMKVLACVALVVCALACGGKSSDGGVGGVGAGSTAGKGGTAGDGASNPDGGSAVAGSGSTAGNGTGTTDGGGEDVDAGLTPIEAPPAIADLAASLSEGVCGALKACLGPSALAEQLGGEDCVKRFTAETLSGEFASLQASIDASRVVLDSTQIDVCVAGIKAMGCAIQTDSFPEACEKAIEGKVAVGAACVLDADCVGTAYCKLDSSCPSLCANLLADGDECSKDDECGDDLVCFGGKCQAPAGEGDACEGDSGAECALGLVCWDADDMPVVAGKCHTTAETLAGSEGDECSPGSVLCKEGLSCAYSAASSTQFACAARVSSGGKCHLALPGQCPADEYCDTTSATAEGTCSARPSEGEACLSGGKCAPSFVCVPDGKGGGVCNRIQNNGGACKIDDACRSGYCDAAVCEPPPVCD